MSEKILIGKAKAKNDKDEVIELKIYLGNIVELPDRTLTSLREDTYKKILQQWETEHITIIPPESPKMENLDEPKEITNDLEDPKNDTTEVSKDTVEISAPEVSLAATEEPQVEQHDPDNLGKINNEKLEHTEAKPKESKKSKTIHIIINVVIILLTIVATYIATPYISDYVERNNSEIISTQPSPTPGTTDEISIVRSVIDISQGEVITEEMLTAYKISAEEYEQMNNAVYVGADGSTANGSLVLSDNMDNVVGKFATRNISKGTYITTQDYSTQKIIAEKTFIEVEIDGQTVSVPVDSDYLTGDTRVKIVALITSETNNETIAVALSELILEDRTLQDIFDSAGQSILDKLSAQ